MGRYIFKRLVYIIPTFLMLTLLVYAILALSPSDPVALILGPTATEAQYEQLREEMGFNNNILVRYVRYMSQLAKGDMGISWISQTSVMKEFSARLPNTLILTGWALILTIIIGIPLGVLAAVYQNRMVDRVTMIFAMLIIALPSFFLGLLAQLLFCLRLGWLPVTGAATWKHFILPSFILAASRIAGQIRMTRSSMLDVISQDYIRTANAKGASRVRVIFYHALRNGLLPVITNIGNNVGGIVAGAVTVETIFAVPGIGSMLVTSVRTSDIPSVMGPIIFISLLVCTINLLVDILYAVIDPRIRQQYAKRRRAG